MLFVSTWSIQEQSICSSDIHYEKETGSESPHSKSRLYCFYMARTLLSKLISGRLQLAAEWKEKQGFKHMLALRQQQQQTQASQNPYLMQNTQPVYNPGSLYQPPLPLPNTTRSAPYLGGQGTPQPLNRATVAAMSPEHLPGAWTCSACTYINFPGRTVCESCGLVNSPSKCKGHCLA